MTRHRDGEGPQVDPVQAWRDAFDRVCVLVERLDAAELAARVPACPDWTVRDLLSHMVGLCADVLAGDEPDDHNSAWTQRQVEARRSRSAPDLLAEWRALADPLTAWMRERGSRPLNDVVIHEQDLRGAVGVVGGRDSDGLRIVRDRMAGRFASALDDLPPVALVSGEWTWCSQGEARDAAVVVEADGFDLARALTSRRTADQLRSWTRRGDVTPYLDAFAALGPLPTAALPE
jgi:uncharacterized protein (TIGR03083 family)